MSTAAESRRYLRSGAIDRVLNLLVTGLTRLGVSLYGSRILEVKGPTDLSSAEANDLLRRWGRLHAVRSALGLAVFGALLL